MKLPKTFTPEKEYSKKKIYGIVKKHHRKPEDIDENITLENRIINQAKKVAKILGKHISATYLFIDIKSNLTISYDPSVAFQDIQLLTIQKQGRSKKEYLFKSIKWDEYSKEEIRIYVPGDWQVSLDKLYKRAQKK